MDSNKNNYNKYNNNISVLISWARSSQSRPNGSHMGLLRLFLFLSRSSFQPYFVFLCKCCKIRKLILPRGVILWWIIDERWILDKGYQLLCLVHMEILRVWSFVFWKEIELWHWKMVALGRMEWKTSHIKHLSVFLLKYRTYSNWNVLPNRTFLHLWTLGLWKFFFKSFLSFFFLENENLHFLLIKNKKTYVCAD